MRSVVVVLLLGLASPAHAEPDSGTATLLSLGGTALPIAGLVSIPSLPRRAKQPMFIASMATLLVAPSAGQFYAGDHFSTGFRVRLAGGALTALGTGIVLGCKTADRERVVSCLLGGATLGAIGIATMFAGAAHDVATADTARPRVFSIGARF